MGIDSILHPELSHPRNFLLQTFTRCGFQPALDALPLDREMKPLSTSPKDFIRSGLINISFKAVRQESPASSKETFITSCPQVATTARWYKTRTTSV